MKTILRMLSGVNQALGWTWYFVGWDPRVQVAIKDGFVVAATAGGGRIWIAE